MHTVTPGKWATFWFQLAVCSRGLQEGEDMTARVNAGSGRKTKDQKDTVSSLYQVKVRS